jgi:hypothetical protein
VFARISIIARTHDSAIEVDSIGSLNGIADANNLVACEISKSVSPERMPNCESRMRERWRCSAASVWAGIPLSQLVRIPRVVSNFTILNAVQLGSNTPDRTSPSRRCPNTLSVCLPTASIASSLISTPCPYLSPCERSKIQMSRCR